MTDEDRAVIRDAVTGAVEQHIVITHGTDTMVNTAAELTEIEGKTIVFTGALAPAIFRDSDALFNLGGAVAAAQCAAPGVYITMNGRVFEYDKVRKDVANNRFVALED